MSVRKSTNYIVVHCSATKPGMDIGAKEIGEWHKKNGWSGIGYHLVIRRDGTVEEGRPLDDVGAHVKDYNSDSVGVCMVGGVGEDGKAQNNFTPLQFKTLKDIIRWLRVKYKKAHICGHRDLSPDLNQDGKITSNEWIKECPSFDVEEWMIRNNV